MRKSDYDDYVDGYLGGWNTSMAGLKGAADRELEEQMAKASQRSYAPPRTASVSGGMGVLGQLVVFALIIAGLIYAGVPVTYLLLFGAGLVALVLVLKGIQRLWEMFIETWWGKLTVLGGIAAGIYYLTTLGA
jgi:hypothetical protein